MQLTITAICLPFVLLVVVNLAAGPGYAVTVAALAAVVLLGLSARLRWKKSMKPEREGN